MSETDVVASEIDVVVSEIVLVTRAEIVPLHIVKCALIIQGVYLPSLRHVPPSRFITSHSCF